MENQDTEQKAPAIQRTGFEMGGDIAALAKALNIAQSSLEGAKKDSSNPFFKSKYADLSSVMEAVKPVLSKSGLSISQHPVREDGLTGVITVLLHISGGYIMSKLLLKPAKDDPQATGSAITYARRYAIAAALGVTQEDDDANSVSYVSKTTKKAPYRK